MTFRTFGIRIRTNDQFRENLKEQVPEVFAFAGALQEGVFIRQMPNVAGWGKGGPAVTHHSSSNEITAPKPTDPPFLFAILIGAMRTGDTMMQSLAREWLADIGVRVQVAKDAPVLTNHNKVLSDGR